MADVLYWACPKGRTKSISSVICYGFVYEQIRLLLGHDAQNIWLLHLGWDSGP